MMYKSFAFDDYMTESVDDDMEQLMKEKAHELFTICDSEHKGYIAKQDMQKLESELQLSPEQLEHVFDSLDDDGNGFLTLDEFTDGFGVQAWCFCSSAGRLYSICPRFAVLRSVAGVLRCKSVVKFSAEEIASYAKDKEEWNLSSFLGIKSTSSCSDKTEDSEVTITNSNSEGKPDSLEEQQNFKHMMETIGATNLYDDESTVQALWCRLRRDDPDMAAHFENFVYRVSTEIKKSKMDFNTLEGVLKSKTNTHDEEVKKLYEEMEYQIKQEKEKILEEERLKEYQLREAMEKELQEKDKLLQDLIAKHNEMEERLGHLNTVETETKIENEKLAKEKEELEELLNRSQNRLDESQTYINMLQQQQRDEKRERARAAMKLSEGIALERETMVKQLDMLRNMNRKLQDDKDEAEIRRDYSFQTTSLDMQLEQSTIEKPSPKRVELERQGSSLGKYFNTCRIQKMHSCEEAICEEVLDDCERQLTYLDDDIECDDDLYIDRHCPACIHHSVNTIHQQYHEPIQQASQGMTSSMGGTHSDIERAAAHNNFDRSEGGAKDEATCASRVMTLADSTTRDQPIGANEWNNSLTDSGIQSYIKSSPLQRIFKIVFVGDSGVGKSSFIHRICTNIFRASFATTIGVDFHIKSLPIDDQLIVLQLWDTAGQERFRSITKQYFRRADGIIIMYDVTSESSFTSVRNWMSSVKEGASEDAVLEVIGNKTDLPEIIHAVKMKDGSRLAYEYGALFYETSAFNGENISNAIEALARVLKDKQDIEIEKSFHLEEMDTKKRCCI